MDKSNSYFRLFLKHRNRNLFHNISFYYIISLGVCFNNRSNLVITKKLPNNTIINENVCRNETKTKTNSFSYQLYCQFSNTKFDVYLPIRFLSLKLLLLVVFVFQIVTFSFLVAKITLRNCIQHIIIIILERKLFQFCYI